MMLSGSGDAAASRSISVMSTEAWREQPVRAGRRIGSSSLDRLSQHRLVVLFGRSLKEDIRYGR
jgi:hypothetical protein